MRRRWRGSGRCLGDEVAKRYLLVATAIIDGLFRARRW
jgi:hypothetical protein